SREDYLRVTHPSAALLMAEATFSLDLHVLGPPLTFALSQDQTLHRKVLNPALRWLIDRTRGEVFGQRGMVSFEQKLNLPKLACYPVFRDRSRREATFSSVSTAWGRR